MKLLISLALLALMTACSHPLEIVGNGDISSSTGANDCSMEKQPCNNYVVGDYTVTYTAKPLPGWSFVRWEGCGAQFPECSFDVPAVAVDQYLGKVMPPLRAVFEREMLTTADVCADANNCTLSEAGRIAGVRFGLTTGPVQGQRRDLLSAEANLGVNHAFSWNVMWPQRDTWSFDSADEWQDFNRELALPTAAFHFAWEQDILDDLPDWVQEVDNPDELRALLAQRAQVIFERYPDLERINVINEPLPTLGQSSQVHQNYFYRVLGPDYIAELFEIVNAAAPDTVKLVLNENFVEYFPAKAEGLVALVSDLVRRGVPIDSVGFQTHLMLTEIFATEPDWARYKDTMRQISDLGVDVWISELDNPVSPERPDRFAYQAGNYESAVRACLSVPRCSDIVVWGVEDTENYWFSLPYEDAAPLLFDKDFLPKPAYFYVREALLTGRPVQ